MDLQKCCVGISCQLIFTLFSDVLVEDVVFSNFCHLYQPVKATPGKEIKVKEIVAKFFKIRAQANIPKIRILQTSEFFTQNVG